MRLKFKEFEGMPGLINIVEDDETIAIRVAKYERKLRIANELGVDLTLFDGEDDLVVFGSTARKIQHEKDVMMLGIYLNREEEIPQDLRERLLEIKYRREKLKRIRSNKK